MHNDNIKASRIIIY